MSRAAQREATRLRIVEAAAEAFTEMGFAAAGTRGIASRAGTTQGLVTYHFASKELLWRAAADHIFEQLPAMTRGAPEQPAGDSGLEFARAAIGQFVRFAAEHPEVLRFMLDDGGESRERVRWLANTHLAPRFDAVAALVAGVSPGAEPERAAHTFYALVGAASLIFAVAPECEELSGVNPLTPESIDRHAEFVADLFAGLLVR